MQTIEYHSFPLNGVNVLSQGKNSLLLMKYIAIISYLHLGGTDCYENLILIKNSVHKLIHASKAETIYKYMDLLQLDNKQLIKVNHFRELASMQPI